MYGKINKIPAQLDSLNSKLEALKEQPIFTHAQAVIDEIAALFGVNSAGSWSLINDSRGKIKANASWFELAEGFADRRAAYKLAENNDKNIDFKTFWVQKPSKSIVSWIVALTPNFEDEPYNVNKNVGIDFIIPKKSDRVIIALSNSYIIRTLELNGSLTPTQQNILIKWTQSFDFANKPQLHKILWDSFDLEPVNKEFYKEISSYFVELKQHLLSLDLFDEKHAAYFSSRLIGRLIFCWFIDKKGFINPDMHYFDVSQDSTNYYHNKLEKLFFATLNTPLEERGVKFESTQSNLFSSHERENNLFNIGIDMVTPFLNGGLFEERETDFVGNKNLTFPTDYFHRLIQTLNHYNFTTDESTSSFQQVAIDPEMLGRIFENLLAEQSEETGEQARKAKGAFYTPREIVDYMCRESLREYLKTRIPYDEMRDSKLELLLDKKSHEYRDQQKNFRQYLKNYKSDIIDALDDLKVLDPACGSGAFPMGMLQLLVQVYERLEPRFDQYETKVAIVKNNIYGVDIEPMAVEISRLRTWLSIIVDEEVDSNKVKPLPNLDFKFVCANSLIPLDQNGAQGLLDDSDLEDKLVEIREKYFNARTHNSKKNLKDKLNKLIGYSSDGKQLSSFKSDRQLQLESYQPFNPENVAEFFDADFMFGQEKFDIIIGNPPYVQIKKIKYKAFLSKLEYKTFMFSGDLYVLFYEFANNLLAEKGIGTYITSNKWMRSSYGSLLRYYLNCNAFPIRVIDFSNHRVFKSALVDTNILIWTKDVSNLKNPILTANFQDSLNQLVFNKQHFQSNEPWLVLSQKQDALLNKLSLIKKYVSNYNLNFYYGILTGANPVFIINNRKKEELSELNKRISELIVPLLRGQDIERYSYRFSEVYLLLLHNGMKRKGIPPINVEKDYPELIQYLNSFGDKFIKRGEQGKNWWNLRNCSYLDIFSENKIIYSDISSKRGKFYLDEKGFYTNDTAFIISGNNLEFFLGLFNSKLFSYIYANFYSGGVLGNEGIRYKKEFILQVPIPEVEQKRMVEIGLLARQLNGGESENARRCIDDELDRRIYDLYNLSDEEIQLIESWFGS